MFSILNPTFFNDSPFFTNYEYERQLKARQHQQQLQRERERQAMLQRLHRQQQWEAEQEELERERERRLREQQHAHSTKKRSSQKHQKKCTTRPDRATNSWTIIPRQTATPRSEKALGDYASSENEELPSTIPVATTQPSTPPSTPPPTPPPSKHRTFSQQDQEEAAAKIQRVFREYVARKSALQSLSTLSLLESNLHSLLPSESSHFLKTLTSNLILDPQNPKRLLMGCKQNLPILKLEEDLTRLLVSLDAVESFGVDKVRKRRKEVVKRVQEALAKVEEAKREGIRRAYECRMDVDGEDEERFETASEDDEDVGKDLV
ncbi:hypothetical protein HDV05_002485 [Chytridiales sp. JEL 0842]|nr:hypothetical protein HDV05_002485 [Chytridiales sp. JEL 0842]